jgi:formylglycine-generating enzyme required for sulfatase activity
MKINRRSILPIILSLVLTSVMPSALAQEVTIPDPGLNAAIREALQKPSGPLTAQDLLGLTNLDASGRNVSSVEGLEAARNLTTLLLEKNQLTNLVLSSDLIHLVQVDLDENELTNLILPSGMTNLSELSLAGNQLTTLTLPPDMTQLTALFLDGNPLGTIVLSEPQAAVNLAETVASLRSQGVSVLTYPLTAQLISPRLSVAGGFEFRLIGPPGVYSVLASADLSAWSALGALTNTLGSAGFTDTTASLSRQKFYRALLPSPPTNMVFIPPGTFTLGSPTNEVGRSPNEGPQTVVTISHGFWMGRHPVTQAEYMAVTGANPSNFKGDLRRPVESVSWDSATNYCAMLTRQELAAGHILVGSRYRLPTEAEWEYAARAGTTARYYYGDDPGAIMLTSHAWDASNSGAMTHPVEQKPANPWGLFDMEGNVWELCQDWFGPYAGGSETDPQGPASSPIGVKVMRGGAWDAFDSDCRSASRGTFGESPFITDIVVGFRVVLSAN